MVLSDLGEPPLATWLAHPLGRGYTHFASLTRAHERRDAQPVEQTLRIAHIFLPYFHVTPPLNLTIRCARIAADLTIAGQRFGQQAEALTTVLP